MSDFTADELWSAIKKHDEEDYLCNYGYSEGFSFESEYGTVSTVEIQPWRVEVNEFAGSYTDWVVYFVVEVQGRYFRLSGIDSSWDSPGIESIEEVEPVEQVVTMWEAKHGN